MPEYQKNSPDHLEMTPGNKSLEKKLNDKSIITGSLVKNPNLRTAQTPTALHQPMGLCEKQAIVSVIA
jgi:hypothetical protein